MSSKMRTEKFANKKGRASYYILYFQFRELAKSIKYYVRIVHGA